jgi:hypothetical protein
LEPGPPDHRRWHDCLWICIYLYVYIYIYTYTSTLVYTYIAVYVLTFSLLTCLADQVRMPCARRQRQVISLTNNQMPHWMSCAACVGTTFGLRLEAHRLRPPDVPKHGFVNKVPNAKRHPEKARHASTMVSARHLKG